MAEVEKVYVTYNDVSLPPSLQLGCPSCDLEHGCHRRMQAAARRCLSD